MTERPQPKHLQNKKLHLTFKTWLSDDQIENIRRRWKDEKQFSYCHENADAEDPYEHTHVYVRAGKEIKSESMAYFDIDGIHPSWKVVLTMEHERNILKYHRKEGIKCVQEPWQEFWTADEMAEEFRKHDLFELVEKRNIKIKSLNDLKILKDAKRHKARHDRQFEPEEFNEPCLTDVTCAYVEGETRRGKTQWALAGFKNPLSVDDIDDLKSFTPEHDAIVFDDMSFKHWPRGSVIHLTDWDMDRSIRTRNVNALIPKHTPKVFCANIPFEECFPEDPSGAIRDRFSHIVYVGKDLRKNPTVGRQGPKMMTLGEPKVNPTDKTIDDAMTDYIREHPPLNINGGGR